MTTKFSTRHVRKRQYQPSIASYLNRDAAPMQHERSDAPLSPQLPAETQASLLSVGMRVRKSVPEGYKTHKTVQTQAFIFSSTAPPASTAPQPSKVSYTVTGPKELQPFCGLHKTGGFAAQEIPPSSAPAVMQTDEDSEDEMPRLTMSQSTVPSTQDSFVPSATTMASASRKRTYEDEIEDELDAYFDFYDEEGVGGTFVTNVVRDRPMARLKSSARRAQQGEAIRVAGADDFDDAAFLAPPDGMDTD